MRYNNKNYTLPEPIIDYLCFTANTAGSTISLTNNNGNSPNIEYSMDKQNWTTWDFSTITLANIGDKVYMRGNNTSGFSQSNSAYSFFSMTGAISASGDLMSLINKTNFPTTIPNNYCFYFLFANNNSIITAPKLNAIILKENCYRGMFYNCHNLTTCTTFNATTLAVQCCRSMFQNCSSLVNIPDILPATTLATQCYYNMFGICTSLVESPILPASTLANTCYQDMFNGCTSLKKITCYATSGIGNTGVAGTSNWCYNITRRDGSFYKASGASWPSGASGIPTGWTVYTL